MMDTRTFVVSVIKKGVVGVVIGGVLAGGARALDFPPVFQVMFFIYAMLGAAVFILLDAPTVRPMGGAKALVTLLVFYAVLSGAYIVGASFLPQYDPQDEKGKIEKLLKAKRAATEQGKAEELLARTKALSEKADAIMARL
jgi:uncharacterized membrane protein YeaQ/YmgE (transglycosylase-associated protein family)